MNTELAWSAGFIDGEGTFGIQQQKGRKPLLYLQAGQVDRFVLDRLQTALGLGKVYGPYHPRRDGHQPYFYYRLTGNKTQEVFAKLEPYLSKVKLAQFQTNDRKVNPKVVREQS